MERPYRDRDWLDARYHGDGLTLRELGGLCGVATVTVRRWMKRLGVETREITGKHHGLYGTERSEETKRKISETMQGREVSEETLRKFSEWQRGRELSTPVRQKISDSLTGITRSPETRMKMSQSTAGELNPNWQGGEYSEEWYGPGWAVIRDRIRDRDEICQHCGHDGSDTRLEVHHIVLLRRFRDRDDVSIEEGNRESNLVLLCKSCHGLAEHGIIDVGSAVGVTDFE